jgi:DNA modification methylase
MSKITLYHGNCMSVLPTLPTGSVQCVVTSPPYLGMRDYGLPPVVWGSNGEDCEHLWSGANAGEGEQRKAWGGQFCAHCGAWQGSLGCEPSIELYVAHIVEVFRQVWRVLRDDGTLWVVIGDAYANDSKWGGHSSGKNADSAAGGYSGQRQRRHTGLKPKSLMGMPWRVAFALQDDGWTLRRDVIWHKIDVRPENVVDRPTTAHEYVFLLTKRPRYYYDLEAVREPYSGDYATAEEYRARAGTKPRYTEANSDPANGGYRGGGALHGEALSFHPAGRNRRSVWSIATGHQGEPHYAVFPPELAELCILAGTSARGSCPRCGAPWRRVRGIPGTPDGWQPGCRCGAAGEPVPCAVLDPFGGSGTVGLVASRLGRDATLIDLSRKYVDMACRRIAADAPLLAAVEVVSASAG